MEEGKLFGEISRKSRKGKCRRNNKSTTRDAFVGRDKIPFMCSLSHSPDRNQLKDCRSRMEINIPTALQCVQRDVCNSMRATLLSTKY